MSVHEMLAPLQQQQQQLLDMLTHTPASDYSRQFHPDLSPLGWHLGHCVFTETYWLREVVLAIDTISDEHKQLYIPELSVKTARATALPEHAELCQWAEDSQQQNLEHLSELIDAGSDVALMQDNFLVYFLCQHYAQHIETANYILTQKNLQDDVGFEVESALEAQAIQANYHQLETGLYTIGSTDPLHHYDNESPGFSLELQAFEIADMPVTNAEFLGFIEAGGYLTKEHWSEQAWLWREQNAITRPQHWREGTNGNYYGTNAKGAYHLESDKPVAGLSHHEASAMASWANARLPHEYEWEAAKKTGVLQGTGHAWEWCENYFHPYAGFSAFPYEGYSIPWFDKQHFTLRGASEYTASIIQRDSFRNFYQANKRHFPAGLRLVSR
jgi:gamma-glutamyl hercynylcysteine S-oxide synthase